LRTSSNQKDRVPILLPLLPGLSPSSPSPSPSLSLSLSLSLFSAPLFHFAVLFSNGTPQVDNFLVIRSTLAKNPAVPSAKRVSISAIAIDRQDTIIAVTRSYHGLGSSDIGSERSAFHTAYAIVRRAIVSRELPSPFISRRAIFVLAADR